MERGAKRRHSKDNESNEKENRTARAVRGPHRLRSFGVRGTLRNFLLEEVLGATARAVTSLALESAVRACRFRLPCGLLILPALQTPCRDYPEIGTVVLS